MDLTKIDKQELKTYNLTKLKEYEVAVRRELATIKLEVYAEKGKKSGQVRNLKRNVARALTFAHQKRVSV